MAVPAAATVQATAAAVTAGMKDGRREEEEGLIGFPGGGNDEKGNRSDTIAHCRTL